MRPAPGVLLGLGLAHGERLSVDLKDGLVVHVFREAGLELDQARLDAFKTALERLAQFGDERLRRWRSQSAS